LLKPYLAARHEEITLWNQENGEGESVLNLRKMTNIGTFRAYLNEYLRSHPRIRNDMTLMVRQLAPDDNGLPIEIYAFTNTVIWAEYEERSEEHTSELQSRENLVCRLLLEKKNLTRIE